MGSRYDSRTTIFSPEGRLYQVEYAIQAISHAGTCVGIATKDGIILAAEKKIHTKLLESTTAEKMIKIDDNLACAVAGITADANILVNYARLSAQRYLFRYGEAQPVEGLVRQVCDMKQGYTQFGGLRPFGVSFLYAGWDEHYGLQLYMSDPSGNYSGWKAVAIGANHQSATSLLKQEYSADLNLQDGLKFAVKVLSKTMDSTSLTPEKLEFSYLQKDNFHVLTDQELIDLVESSELVPQD